MTEVQSGGYKFNIGDVVMRVGATRINGQSALGVGMVGKIVKRYDVKVVTGGYVLPYVYSVYFPQLLVDNKSVPVTVPEQDLIKYQSTGVTPVTYPPVYTIDSSTESETVDKILSGTSSFSVGDRVMRIGRRFGSDGYRSRGTIVQITERVKIPQHVNPISQLCIVNFQDVYNVSVQKGKGMLVAVPSSELRLIKKEDVKKLKIYHKKNNVKLSPETALIVAQKLMDLFGEPNRKVSQIYNYGVYNYARTELEVNKDMFNDIKDVMEEL